jgi:MoaA/NifB/PqqE/SkfB family radical SAM enzyme
MQKTLITDLSYVEAPAAPLPLPTLSATILASPWRRRLVAARFQLAEAHLLWRLLRQPRRIRLAQQRVEELKQAYYGNFRVQKIACVAGRYYREYQTPGWPGASFEAYVASTVNRLVPFRPATDHLQLVYLAITKKCPLACEHCFEWNALNQREVLSRVHIQTMVAQFQVRHATQIFFSGGEPMLRVNDLVAVAEAARPGTDFWVITSGFNFTPENAQRLKQAGFTGVTISLDHHEPARHNAFRGSPQAYQQAVQAAAHAHAVGLVVNLSLCLTQEFVSEVNLWAYLHLARQLGVTFVQLLEPRAVGHYAGKAVDLSSSQIELLEQLYELLSFSPDYLDWPILHYYGYHQRRMGCSGAADRFLYVDTDGDMHACPFCQKKSGNALCGSLDESLSQIRTNGCHAFAQSKW